MAQSKNLTRFYKEFEAWLNDNCPLNECFSNDVGLCWNLQRWSQKELGDTYYIYEEMKDQFQNAGLCHIYPFNPKNTGEELSYWDETAMKMCHLNTKRRQWIKNHANV